jgi:hypothetical protein
MIRTRQHFGIQTLHLDNVFSDPKSKQTTRVIDWQSAAVLPFFYQYGVATMFKHQETVSDDILSGLSVLRIITAWNMTRRKWSTISSGASVSINITLQLRITKTQDIGPPYNCKTTYEHNQHALSRAYGKIAMYYSFGER